jgi:hypothetical protein
MWKCRDCYVISIYGTPENVSHKEFHKHRPCGQTFENNLITADVKRLWQQVEAEHALTPAIKNAKVDRGITLHLTKKVCVGVVKRIVKPVQGIGLTKV